MLHGRLRGPANGKPRIRQPREQRGRPFGDIVPLDEADQHRFIRSLRGRQPGECWIWPGAKSKFGHGRFKAKGRLHLAHRVAFAIWKGDEIAGQGRGLVLHSCDNPSCCNPDHLRLGTYRDNVMDMIERNRHPAQLRNAPSQACREAYAAKFSTPSQHSR